MQAGRKRDKNDATRERKISARIKSRRKRQWNRYGDGGIIAIWGSRRDRCNESYECNPCTLSKDVTADRQRQIRPRREFNGTSILILHSTPLDQRDRHSGDIWASSQSTASLPARLHPSDALVYYSGTFCRCIKKIENRLKKYSSQRIFSLSIIYS